MTLLETLHSSVTDVPVTYQLSPAGQQLQDKDCICWRCNNEMYVESATRYSIKYRCDGCHTSRIVR